MSSSTSSVGTNTGATLKIKAPQRQQKRAGKKDTSTKRGFSLFSEDKPKGKSNYQFSMLQLNTNATIALQVNKNELDNMCKARRDKVPDKVSNVITTKNLAVLSGSQKQPAKATPVPNARGKFSSAVAPGIARATPTMVLPTLPTKRT
jgi:4-diphosphocytidyl-2C-methyl-D-erythritol kinase